MGLVSTSFLLWWLGWLVAAALWVYANFGVVGASCKFKEKNLHCSPRKFDLFFPRWGWPLTLIDTG